LTDIQEGRLAGVLKFMAAFVVGAGAGLAVSWSYILSMKAKIKVCLGYIHDRIGEGMDAELMDRSTQEEREAKGPGKGTPTPSTGARSSRPGRATVAEKPHLIVSVSGNGKLVSYVCSSCLRSFPLLENQSPKEVVAELFRRFKEHREQEHPELSAGTSP
jgi:hypothetical protein